MIKLKDILSEIGDASAKKFDWKVVRASKTGTTRYEFETSAGLYDVEFIFYKKPMSGAKTVIDKPSYDWIFGVDDSYSVVTNKGEAFKVMATIMDIMKDFIKSRMAKSVDYITFHGSKKGGEDAGASKRTKFYLNYIKHHNIGDIIQKGNEVAIKVKK